MKFSMLALCRLLVVFAVLPLAAVAQTNLPAAQVGASYSFQITTNPAAAAGSVYSAVGLPAGLGINSSSGLLSGTPTAAGTYNGTVSVASGSTTNNYAVRIVVSAATGTPAITSATTASGAVGTAFNYNVTASNSPTSFNIGTPPAGLSIGGTVTAPTITGSPTAAGSFQVALSGINASGTGATTILTITIAAAAGTPVLTSTTSPAAVAVGGALSYQITATNSPTSYAAAGLPLGVTLNASSGLISGTPTVAGIYPVTVSAANASGSGAPATVNFVVGSVPAITSSLAASGTVNAPFSYTATASNTPTSFNVGALPAGLTANAATGVISGTPSTTGVTSVQLSANNATGTGANATLVITISAAAAPPPIVPVSAPVIVSHPGSATVTVGANVTFSVSATGTGLSFQWSRNGTAIAGAVSASYSITGVTTAHAGAYTVQVTNSSGTAASNSATLTVTDPNAPVAPAISAHPTAQSITAGGAATFSVIASGTGPLSYQWLKDGIAIAGATSSTLTLSNAPTSAAGGYSVVVSNAAGSVTSNSATLTVTALNAPTITLQPLAQSIAAGGSVTFTVVATGSGTLSYQWRKDGMAILGATNASLTVANATSASAGSYSVVVSNSAGSATSNAAALTISPRPIAGTYFGTFAGGGGSFALHVRSDRTGVFLGYAAATRIALLSRNVVVDAEGRFAATQPAPAFVDARTSGTEAEGPLAHEGDYHIDGAIAADGQLSGAVSGLNLGFSAPAGAMSGPTAAVAGFYQSGAAGSAAQTFSIVSPAGQVLVVTQSGTTVDAGVGTVTAAGAIAVTTAANATISGSIAPATSTLTMTVTPPAGPATTFVGANDARTDIEKLINISTRSQAGTTSEALIAGFVIAGTQPKPVLVRAVGPTLGTTFGIGTALSAARLEVFRGETSIAVGTDWGAATNAATVATTAARVGAFALPATSRDAALLLTLEPGNYTAVVTGQGTARGVALVEIYDATSGDIPRNQRIVNVATRATAGTAENSLIAGFVINGTVPKRVLIRGAGPALAQFAVPNVLARPQLTIHSGATVVAQNAGWSTSADAAAIASAAIQAGAFAFAANSQDAAVILNLSPGAYTAIVSGVGGTTGTALVEVYELQ